MTARDSDIAVLGGGPAGTATAIGLRRLGYQVTLVHSSRLGPRCEGISARTLNGLKRAGLDSACAVVAAATPRAAHWNGESLAVNTEHLVQRAEFDLCLLDDLRRAGVCRIEGRIRDMDREVSGCRIAYLDARGREHNLRCRFAVEARGRAAPGLGEARLRGPETVAFLQVRQGPGETPGSLVSSFRQGWAWLARPGDGRVFVQLALSASAAQLPRREVLADWFEQQIGSVALIAEACGQSEPVGEIIARGSTSILHGRLVDSSLLRVGDAAMAVDPLSGNGIFQALSSALIAPAVINTILNHPDEAGLARQFYEDRVKHTFLRFARTGRDFYRLESRWPDEPFWRERRNWPDSEPGHGESTPAITGIDTRPVLASDRIRARQVVVTSDHPLGVWHVGGVELAPLLRNLPADSGEKKTQLQLRLQQAAGDDHNRKRLLEAWMARYRQL